MMTDMLSRGHLPRHMKSHTAEIYEEMKNICFTNLMLLGFDVELEESNHKIKFHRDMFDDVNKVGCEVILHFLLQKLNPDLAREEFKICYPVQDRKQEQMFRKACSTWILSIAKENREFNFPSALSSILMKKGGRKFYPLLFSLSRFVLLEVVKSEFGSTSSSQFPLLPTKLTKLSEVEASRKIFQALLDEHMNQFVANQLYVMRHVKEERLQNLFTQYYYMKKQIKANSASLKSLLDDLEIPIESQLKIVQGEDCDEWNSILENSKQKEQLIHEEWKAVDSILEIKEKMWDVCDVVVIQKKQGTVVRSKDLKEAFIQRDYKKPTDDEEPVKLSSICNLWLDCLTRLLTQMEKLEIPNIRMFSDDLVKLHTNQVDNIEKFKVLLCDDLLPNAQQDCLNLWKEEFSTSNYDFYKEQVKLWQSSSTNQLSVPSPPMSLVSSSSVGSKREKVRRKITKSENKTFTALKINKKSVSDDSHSTSSSDSKMKSASPKEFSLLASSLEGPLMNESRKSPKQFNPDSEFNLGLLESPLCRPSLELIERVVPPKKNSSIRTTLNCHSPPRLLQLLTNMKVDEPDIGYCSSPEGKTPSISEQMQISCIHSNVVQNDWSEEIIEADRESEASASTIESATHSLPMMVSSNLRDFLSWENVLQSSVTLEQDDLLKTKWTTSPVQQPTPANIQIECSPRGASSQTNLSLADIFGEDNSCLLPSSPTSP